jgi:hypothetical protein
MPRHQNIAVGQYAKISSLTLLKTNVYLDFCFGLHKFLPACVRMNCDKIQPAANYVKNSRNYIPDADCQAYHYLCHFLQGNCHCHLSFTVFIPRYGYQAPIKRLT